MCCGGRGPPYEWLKVVFKAKIWLPTTEHPLPTTDHLISLPSHGYAGAEGVVSIVRQLALASFGVTGICPGAVSAWVGRCVCAGINAIGFAAEVKRPPGCAETEEQGWDTFGNA